MATEHSRSSASRSSASRSSSDGTTCVLRIYTTHYNEHRPHRSLGHKAPDHPDASPQARAHPSRVRRRDLLGRLIHSVSLPRDPMIGFVHPRA
jgi:hypothetical protein